MFAPFAIRMGSTMMLEVHVYSAGAFINPINLPFAVKKWLALF